MSQQNHLNSHPLPPPPPQHTLQAQQQQYGRPRAKSGFSFKSNHSRKSSGSAPKIDLHETHEEKEAKRLTGKANPSLAITEMEPSAVASAVKTSIAPLRAIQHLDAQGNPIVEPDRSNPTRSRWERPLDTIRSFEAAIDTGYRKSYIRTESNENNRRSSYYGGTQISTDGDRPRFSQNGRNQRDSMMRPSSYYNSFDNAGPSNGYYPNRARYPRTASEPQFSSGHAVYPVPGAQPSYETVTTSSSGGEPAGYTTDPSSENSSVDRPAGAASREPGESYNFHKNQQYGTHGSAFNGRSQIPMTIQEAAPPRVPIKLGTSSGNVNAGPPPAAATRPSAGEKRKSWFGRRLSKKA